MIVLKPCAKCGGEPELFYTYLGGRSIPAIRCRRCGNMYRQWFWSLERLIAVWNTWNRNEEVEEEHGSCE